MTNEDFNPIKGKNIFFTGIKGSGMTALATLFSSLGANVCGSDIAEKFYTDVILKKNKVSYIEEFKAEHITSEIDMLIFSAAYDPKTHPEIGKARELKIPCYSYPEALGKFSEAKDSIAISGVHGKTSTTALCGTILKNSGLPFSILAGSQVPSFNNECVLEQGERYFIAETCEYRRHFLHFSPETIILTSIEKDHLDYFKDLDDIMSAFQDFCLSLPQKGNLIYCADDPNVLKLIEQIKLKRADINFIDYGFTTSGDYRIQAKGIQQECQVFSLRAFQSDFKLQVPGRHNLLNATAAIALKALLEKKEGQFKAERFAKSTAESLLQFRGSKRRAEILGQAKGILFMDDYAHHPTAIKKTLAGIREFYPNRRLIVDFMSHTYSRTQALFDDFCQSFDQADILILHKIYASAREKKGHLSGKDLYQAIAKNSENTYYFEELEDSLDFLKNTLKSGDLFLSMGAGNNWMVSQSLYKIIQKEEES